MCSLYLTERDYGLVMKRLKTSTLTAWGDLVKIVSHYTDAEQVSIGSVVAVAVVRAALLAVVLLVLRARGWRFRETWNNPLLWILHVGQGWLIVAFAARAVSSFTGWIAPTVAFHAMGAGAMATMIFAFMTRAPLGHTGRPLQASRVTTLAYLLVIGAGTARVLSPL